VYNALEIADAFNQQSAKVNWRAKALCGRAEGNIVQFDSNGLVRLHLNCTDGAWSIEFNRLQTSWGDYMTAIRRSFYSVLNALVSAALSFEAPPSLDDIVVTIMTQPNGKITLSWHLIAVPSVPPMLNIEQTLAYENKFGGT
jgi:hypothetical protein